MPENRGLGASSDDDRDYDDGRAFSETNKTTAQHQSLERFLAPPPLPPTLPQDRLSDVPQNIIDRFERFKKSVRLESGEQTWKNIGIFMAAHSKYEYLSVHPRQKEFLLFLCAVPQFISKNASKGYRPIDHLLGEFEVERWFIQGLGEKVDPESARLILSAFMSHDDLVGHTGDACKWGIDCKGGLTCDERMSLVSPAFGHLQQLNLLIKGDGVIRGLFGICWHMGSSFPDAVSQAVKGFRHSAFKHTPPRSIWTPDYRDYWKQRLHEGWRPHGEVWKPFHDRIKNGLREVESNVLDTKEWFVFVESEDTGLGDCPDEEI